MYAVHPANCNYGEADGKYKLQRALHTSQCNVLYQDAVSKCVIQYVQLLSKSSQWCQTLHHGASSWFLITQSGYWRTYIDKCIKHLSNIVYLSHRILFPPRLSSVWRAQLHFAVTILRHPKFQTGASCCNCTSESKMEKAGVWLVWVGVLKAFWSH